MTSPNLEIKISTVFSNGKLTLLVFILKPRDSNEN